MKKESKKFSRSIGGQAVIEGVMMRGQSAMALAVRDPDNEIAIETYRLSGGKWYKKIPIIRGIVAFGSSLFTGMKIISRSTSMSSKEEESISKGGMAIAMLIGILLAVGLFIILPEFISGLFRDYLYNDIKESYKILFHSLISGAIRIVVFVLYLVFCSKLRDIKRTFMYHGAEHKTINCYESGKELTVENIQKCSTVHRRCGTTFLFLVMIVSILFFALANWLFYILNFNFSNIKILQNLERMGIKLLLLPIIAGVSFEVLKFFSILPYNIFTKIIMAPGLALQKLSTKEPTKDMIEVSLASFIACLEMEEDSRIEEISFPDRFTKDVKKYIERNLKEIEGELCEADWILCYALNEKRSNLNFRNIIKASEYTAIRQIVEKRKEGVPLDYIFGFSEFYKQKIIVTNDVLIPRMETEILCEHAIRLIGEMQKKDKNKDIDVLDLCCGSGCISKAILSCVNVNMTACDLSEQALAVAKQNLEGTKCEIIKSDLFEKIDKKFDMIISNPPYIKSSEIDSLQREVKAQPLIALDGGDDGLDFYKRIIAETPKFLKEEGLILLEIAHDQAKDITKLLKTDFEDIKIVMDLSGSDRVLIGRKKRA